MTETILKVLDAAPVFALLIEANTQTIVAFNPIAAKVLKPLNPKNNTFLSSYFKLPTPFTPQSKVYSLESHQGNMTLKITLSAIDEDYWVLWGEAQAQSTNNGKLQRDFVSTVSHEFRTPLTSIKGFADTMLAYGENLNAEQQKRFITIIKNQADRMIRLTENLLTVSKLDEPRGQLSFRPIALKPMLENMVETLMMKHKEQFPVPVNIKVMNGLPSVWADNDSLEQVLLNLIDNAIKYSAKCQNPAVSVKASLLANDDTMIKIEIADNGIGMTKEQLDNLFHKFYRAESPLTQQIEGTGLGLYITRSLITAMNGKIEVSSTQNEGSTFSLLLPVATAECQALYQKRRVAEQRDDSMTVEPTADE